MDFNATVIADSVHPVTGTRIVTMSLVYPRFIHGEFMTHRVFSRNAASSRAIPVAKMLAQVESNPAMPIHWGLNQAGMQAKVELDQSGKDFAKACWLASARNAVKVAGNMARRDVHKQVVNRILEPFQWMQVVVTATEWDNFFELRDHEDAQPEIAHLARLMKEAMYGSTPVKRDYHLPYLTQAEEDDLGFMWNGLKEMRANVHPAGIKYNNTYGELKKDTYTLLNTLAKYSAARCARVSYLLHDGSEPNADKDLQLYDRLVGGEPIHASPTEHQAFAFVDNPEDCRNFRDWGQFRSIVELGKA